MEYFIKLAENVGSGNLWKIINRGKGTTGNAKIAERILMFIEDKMIKKFRTNKTQENIKKELRIAEIVNKVRTKSRKQEEKTW